MTIRCPPPVPPDGTAWQAMAWFLRRPGRLVTPAGTAAGIDRLCFGVRGATVGERETLPGGVAAAVPDVRFSWTDG